MLLRNMNCNGTRLQVVDFTNHVMKGKILNGDKIGNIVSINRITLYSNEEYPFRLKRRQFPIRLAFAMSINKAQGQTLKKVGMDLQRDVFTQTIIRSTVESKIRGRSKGIH